MNHVVTAPSKAVERLSWHLLNEQTQRWIEESVIAVPFSGCWLWGKSLTVRGAYGQVGYATFGTEKAHRLSYTAFKGLCGGSLVCHHCDVPSCVNPDHLFLGDCRANFEDMVRKGRGNYATTARKSRKLSPDQVAAIRASPLSQMKLAALFGVSGGVVGSIRRRVSYAEVA